MEIRLGRSRPQRERGPDLFPRPPCPRGRGRYYLMMCRSVDANPSRSEFLGLLPVRHVCTLTIVRSGVTGGPFTKYLFLVI